MTPAMTFLVNRPTYQLAAGYSFTSSYYAKNTRFNDWFDHQNFIGTAVARPTQQLTLAASERYVKDFNTNLVAPQATTAGRQEGWSNELSAGLGYAFTSQTSMNLGGTYQIQHYSGQAVDSDQYGFVGSVTHGFTQRFAGEATYRFTYLRLQGQEDSLTHTPSIGFTYRLTPALTFSIDGGAAITKLSEEADWHVSPAGFARLTYFLGFGTASLEYSRGGTVAGGLGGTTDSQTAAATITLATLQRGLFFVATASYNIAESISRDQTGRVDVDTFNLFLGAVYQFARYASLFGGYEYLHQRTGGSSAVQANVDQNRVRIGLQFGYPFSFD
jgi:hypothetical protein